MDLLVILIYAAICITIFKVFHIPINKWSVPTAILGGMVLIATLIFAMNYNHPYAEISRQYFITTPMVPSVSGTVIEVPAKGNTKLKKGDVLFRLDPTPYEAIVQQKMASLEGALQVSVPQLITKLEAARAVLAKAKAERLRAKKELDRFRELYANQSVALADLEVRQKENDKWQATVDEADAKRAQAELALESDVNGENPTVLRLRADLNKAQYDLEQTIVRAPSDGYVIQLALRPGMRVVPMPLRPVMIFVHDEARYHLGWFRQNNLLRLEIGDAAEVAFDGIPGRVFSGEVTDVLPAIAEGQVQASGEMINLLLEPKPGRIPVLIRITDPKYEKYSDRVPGGAIAQTAIYTEYFHHLAIMRKILLRMSAWMNYLFPFH